jgi:nucleoside-diphosphate-sugar epimerase
MLKKILLVGGTGYVGRHLSRYLIEEDSEVFITGTSNKNEENYFKINFEDLQSFHSLDGFKFDLIIVLASKLDSLSTSNLKHPDLSINALGYASFLQYLKDHHLATKIIYISSMTVYSPNNQLPVSECGVIAPVNTYGLSKYIAECMTSFFCTNSNIMGAILRLPGIYGGDKRGGFIYNTLNNLKHDKPFEISTTNLIFWETIHVDDLCFMIKNFVKEYKWVQKIDVYNVCYGRETDFYDTFEFIKTHTGKQEATISETAKGYIPFFLSNQKLKEIIPVREDYFGKLKEYISGMG